MHAAFKKEIMDVQFPELPPASPPSQPPEDSAADSVQLQDDCSVVRDQDAHHGLVTSGSLHNHCETDEPYLMSFSEMEGQSSVAFSSADSSPPPEALLSTPPEPKTESTISSAITSESLTAESPQLSPSVPSSLAVDSNNNPNWNQHQSETTNTNNAVEDEGKEMAAAISVFSDDGLKQLQRIAETLAKNVRATPLDTVQVAHNDNDGIASGTENLLPTNGVAAVAPASLEAVLSHYQNLANWQRLLASQQNLGGLLPVGLSVPVSMAYPLTSTENTTVETATCGRTSPSLLGGSGGGGNQTPTVSSEMDEPLNLRMSTVGCGDDNCSSPASLARVSSFEQSYNQVLNGETLCISPVAADALPPCEGTTPNETPSSHCDNQDDDQDNGFIGDSSVPSSWESLMSQIACGLAANATGSGQPRPPIGLADNNGVPRSTLSSGRGTGTKQSSSSGSASVTGATSSSTTGSHGVSGNWAFEDQFKNLYSLSNDPKRKEFLDDLFKFMQEQGNPINRIPIMAKQTLDLYELYRLVTERGGLVEVINKKLWREVTKGLNLPSSITSAAFTLRTQYMRFLYAYECRQFNFSTMSELQSAIDGNKREGRRLGLEFSPTTAPGAGATSNGPSVVGSPSVPTSVPLGVGSVQNSSVMKRPSTPNGSGVVGRGNGDFIPDNLTSSNNELPVNVDPASTGALHSPTSSTPLNAAAVAAHAQANQQALFAALTASATNPLALLNLQQLKDTMAGAARAFAPVAPTTNASSNGGATNNTLSASTGGGGGGSSSSSSSGKRVHLQNLNSSSLKRDGRSDKDCSPAFNSSMVGCGAKRSKLSSILDRKSGYKSHKTKSDLPGIHCNGLNSSNDATRLGSLLPVDYDSFCVRKIKSELGGGGPPDALWVSVEIEGKRFSGTLTICESH